MRKISFALALVVGLFTTATEAANFTAKDASSATIIFTNPGNCTTGCTPIFSWSDSTGTNLVAVLTAGADGASNTATGGLTYGRNLVFNGSTWDRWTGAVSQSGTWNITNISGAISLPTGASTSALQTTGNTSLATIATNSGTQATAANQATGNTSLATIATNSATQATAANQATGNTSLATIATNSALPLPAQSGHTVNIGAVDSISQYPAGAVPITASATGTTAATTATLAGTSGKTTYICGYSVRANATAAATVTNTVTGVITGTMSSIMWVAPAASGLGIDEPPTFTPCIPASATNTGIAVVSGTPGSGGNVSVKAWGYQL